MKKNRNWLTAIIAAVWAGLAACAYMLGLLSAIDSQIQDLVFQTTAAPSADIQVIGVDEATLSALGPFQEWSRTGTAELISVLNADPEARPAVIAVDITFFGEGDGDGDAALIAACEGSGNVVLARQAEFSKRVISGDSGYTVDTLYVKNMLEPFDGLRAVTQQGHINSILDSDGVVRDALYTLEWQGGVSKSLPAAAAELYSQVTGNSITRPVTDENGCFPLRYTAKSGAYYSGNSMIKVMDGTIPARRFAGSIVFVGAYTAGMQDAYVTALEHDTMTHGVEIQANIADAMINGRYFTDTDMWAQAACIFVILGICTYFFRRSGALKSTILLAAVIVVFAAGVFFARGYGVRFNVLYLTAGLIAAYIVCMIIGYASERRHRAALTGAFKQYVSPGVVDSIVRSGFETSVLNGTRREIAVMFLDIRSFTSLSEMLDAETLVEVLNGYLKLITRVTFANGGTIDKFTGDGAMLLFNAPLDQPDYKYMAVKAALEIMREARALSDDCRERFGRDVMLGAGVNCGAAIVGNIGTDHRVDYTAIGDAVNTSARLEQHAGPGEVIIPQWVYDELAGRIEAQSIGELRLKGKASAVACYRVIGLTDSGRNDK